MADSDEATFKHVAKKTALGALAAAPAGTGASIATGALGGFIVGSFEAFGALDAVRDFFGGPDRRLRDAIEADVRSDAEEAAPVIDAAVAKLGPQERPTAADYAAVFELFARAHVRAVDPRKRAMLKAALGNAFDRELYLKGMTKRLLTMLDDLDYGDLATLAKVARDGHSLPRPPESLFADHVSRLLERNLVHQLRNAGDGTKMIVEITALGRQMFRLAGEVPEGSGP